MFLNNGVSSSSGTCGIVTAMQDESVSKSRNESSIAISEVKFCSCCCCDSVSDDDDDDDDCSGCGAIDESEKVLLEAKFAQLSQPRPDDDDDGNDRSSSLKDAPKLE